MAKLRVHELAKEYNQSSNEFIKNIAEIGISVKSHMSALSKNDVEAIRDGLESETEINRNETKINRNKPAPETEATENDSEFTKEVPVWLESVQETLIELKQGKSASKIKQQSFTQKKLIEDKPDFEINKEKKSAPLDKKIRIKENHISEIESVLEKLTIKEDVFDRSKIFNPYITGNPVKGPASFIGRTDIIKEIQNILMKNNENGLILYGQRRIGKTSVLLELEANLSKQKQFIPIYFDLQDKASLSLDEILHNLTGLISQKFETSFSSLKNGNLSENFNKDFLPELESNLAVESSLILLFDEFDLLDSQNYSHVFSSFLPYLKNLLSFDARKIKLIFVLGRRPEDLSSTYLSLFKNIQSLNLSLLSYEETNSLIRLSEENNSLVWSDEIIKYINHLTGGHPYLTQQLCHIIWENIHEEFHKKIPQVELKHVDNAIPKAIKRSINSLEWLWDGLGSAERLVISAFAESGPELVSLEEMEKKLQENSVQILMGELRNAPIALEELSLIKRENDKFKIIMEILRIWIVERKPLARIQEELDKIQPVAESFFQAAYSLYQSGELNETKQLLRRSLGHNPNHMKANELLAGILFEENRLTEARELLENLYKYSPLAAKPKLVQVMLLQAKEENIENRLELYEKILEIQPENSEALSEYKNLWEKRGDLAFENNDFENALQAYKKSKSMNKIEEVEKKIYLNDLYINAMEILEKNKLKESQELFAKILSIDPEFREATRFMHLAVTGEDINNIKNKNQRLERKNEELLKINAQLKENTIIIQQTDNQNEHIIINDKDELQKRIMEIEKEKLELRNLQQKIKTMIDQSVEARKLKSRSA